jgi:alkylation response protein AidB-like acyl-CoA dehydrogenase
MTDLTYADSPADAATALTLDYVKRREQFGRPVGSFQAVKHRLADMFTAVELARSTCWYAAAAVASGTADGALAGVVAFLGATEAAEFATQEAVQLHGGFGYTWEAGVHRYFRRARLSASLLGPRSELREDALRDYLESQAAQAAS